MAIKDTSRKPFIEDRDTNIFIGLDLPIRKGDGKDVHHKDGNPRNKKRSNLRVTSKRKNRSFRRTRTARKKR